MMEIMVFKIKQNKKVWEAEWKHSAEISQCINASVIYIYDTNTAYIDLQPKNCNMPIII